VPYVVDHIRHILWRNPLCDVQHDFPAISRVAAVLDAT